MKKDKTEYMFAECLSNTRDADKFIKINKLKNVIIIVQWVE